MTAVVKRPPPPVPTPYVASPAALESAARLGFSMPTRDERVFAETLAAWNPEVGE